VTRYALKLAPLVIVRPVELRQAEWTEFSLADGEWRIPAKKMKMRRPHRVPLASQALAILRELQKITGGSRYLFPSVRSWHRPISDSTPNAALRVSDMTRSN
jgi:integrase